MACVSLCVCLKDCAQTNTLQVRQNGHVSGLLRVQYAFVYVQQHEPLPCDHVQQCTCIRRHVNDASAAAKAVHCVYNTVCGTVTLATSDVLMVCGSV